MNRRRLSMLLSGAAVTWLCGSALLGQTSQTIVGTVQDTGGGLIPGVSITARHLLTNDQREAVTNDTGDYQIIRLNRLGLYEVRAEMPGFKVAVAPDILLTTGQTVRVDLVLEVGEISDSVTVQGAAPLVRSETSSLETVVQNREILDLPLYGRNFLELTGLTAGVSTKAPAGIGYQQTNLVAGGARARDNDYRIDGFRSMANYNADMTVKPPIDAIEEFQLIRHQYSAEYGRAMGAIVELRTKSGTNNFHGSVYEFARRGSWSAVPAFARTKPEYLEDQYGGSIGGPVWLPGLYDGRDRSFFFLAYEKFKSPSEKVARFYTLPDAERAGDFSQSLWGTSPIDPLTGEPFPNGIIPLSRMGLGTQKMLGIVPGPNQDLDGTVNWTGNFPFDREYPNWVLRGDHELAENHTLFSSIMWTQDNQFISPALDCGVGCDRISDVNQDAGNTSTVVGYTWAMSPRLVMETRAGYTWSNSYKFLGTDLSKNWSKELGFSHHPPDDQGHLFGAPRVTVRGFGAGPTPGAATFFGHFSGGNLTRSEEAYNLTNIISVTRGDHYVKVGVDILHDRARVLATNGAAGMYWIGYAQVTGNRSADFFMGEYSIGGFQFIPRWSGAKRSQTSWFIHDDWKVSPNLTLNLGIRHDFSPPYTSLQDRIIHYDLVDDIVVYPSALEAQLSQEQKDSLKFPHRYTGPSTTFLGADKMDFSPRVGLAYRPFGGSDMVVRAGYGVFYGSPMGYAIARNWQAAPWQAWLNYGVWGGKPPFPRRFADVQPELGTEEYYIPGNIRVPEAGWQNAYTQHWNFTIQKEIARDMALEVVYAGARGAHLDFEHPGRLFAPIYGRDDFALGGNLRLNTSGADSRYNALQVILQRRFSGGLAFRANYTWGKLMNDTPERFDAAANSTVAHLYRKDQEWGLGQANLRHNVNFSGIFELPFGRNGRWGSSWNRGLDALLGGWRLSYIFDANSGGPINVHWGAFLRPDLASEKKQANLPKKSRSRSRWFDPAAFVAPPPGRQGNVPRNAIEGPNYANLDLGIGKIFTVHEEHRVEFRVEMFNATNHPNFYGGSTVDVTQPSATRLLSAWPMRRVQIGVRYSF